MEETRKRGRPKGIYTGPRNICYVCVAVTDEGKILVVEEVLTPESLSEEEKRNFSATDAGRLFYNKHNCDPRKICGPYFNVQRKNEKKRAKKADISQGDFSGKSVSVICNKYHATAFELKNNPNVYFIKHDSPVDENNKTSKPKDTFYSIENIEFIS